MPKAAIKNPALRTWLNLTEAIMNIKTEEQCYKLIREEQAGNNRKAVIMRIHSRLNRLRRVRERRELLKNEA